MDISRRQAKFTKDKVTALAISLFVFIIMFELVIVLLLPVHLSMESVWVTEMKRDKMLSRVDDLRANLGSIKKRYKGFETGEIDLLHESMDDLARYLRKYGKGLTLKQIDQVQYYLTDYELIYNKLRQGIFYSGRKNIKTDMILRNLTSGYIMAKEADEAAEKLSLERN